MKTVTIYEDIYDPTLQQTVEVEDVCKFLTERFAKWPDTARIYLDAVSQQTDITPYDEATVEKLQEYEGHFYVIVHPEGIETWLIVIAIAVAAVSIGLSFLLRPSVKTPSNNNNESSNNSLSNRVNKERPNERIPDIYGTLRSIPDLIQVPYRKFIDGQEVEYSYMCIGRGTFQVGDVLDDTTAVASISKSAVAVYAPFTSPNSGDDPQYQVGADITEPIVVVKRLNSTNGQVLKATNITGTGWIGPFIVGDGSTSEIWINLVCVSGLYKITSDGVQHAVTADIELGITPVDMNGNPAGAEVVHTLTLTGDATVKSMFGQTLAVTLPAAGPVSIRVRRSTDTDLTAGTNVSDEVQWRDAYSISPVVPTDFGNVTTVQTITWPTPSALAVKERKLNLLVTRKLPKYTAPSTFDPLTLVATNNAADIICAMALDPYIGNRSVTELDCVAIYQAMTDVAAYFGTTYCTEFCYTFDDRNLSFEECIADVATAVFCSAYRRGNVISLYFEKLTANSILLFNHRNKIPNSETRTVSFGFVSENDGIELDYIDPHAPNAADVDTTVTLYYPADQSAKNAKKITTVGIRNKPQAFMFGWRLYQKMLYQNTAIQFNATEEGAVPARSERILVADNTRSDTQDGEVVDQDGLTITLSQPVVFDGVSAYNIFLQHPDATVESIVITPGPNNKMVILAAPPSVPLVLNRDYYARTTYVIISSSARRSDAFLVEEKTPQAGKIYEIKASNYDSRYYDHDTDFINGLVVATVGSTPGPGTAPGTPIAPGARYNPFYYRDIGVKKTVSPYSAIDTDYTTASRVSGFYHYVALGAPTIQPGNCVWYGFPPVIFTADVTLHVFAAHNGSGGLTCEITGMFSDTATVGVTDYTLNIPAGTDISTIEIVVKVAAGFTGIVDRDGWIDVYEIYIQ